MKNKIILDIGSSTTLFCSKNYLKQIKTTQDPIDIRTNGGIIQVKESYQVPQIRKSYHTKDAMTNIIGLADMRKKFRITYNSDKEAVFLVHTPPKIIQLPESSEGMYALDMEQNNNEYENNMIKNKKTQISLM